jgi:dihydrofolate reductase
MTIKACVFIATSLDGFISRTDGSIDWLNEVNALVPEGEDFGYREFMDRTDALIIGRKTFEQALTLGAWPYGDKQVIVMSRKGIKIPEALKENVIASSEDPLLLLNWLALRGARQVYVDGGQTIQSYMREGLIDELTITVIPVLLGTGRPLFGSLPSDVVLKLVFTKSYPFGFVQSKYLIETEANLKYRKKYAGV